MHVQPIFRVFKTLLFTITLEKSAKISNGRVFLCVLSGEELQENKIPFLPLNLTES